MRLPWSVALAVVFAPCFLSLKFFVYNPKFGGSHTMFMGKIADELANAGHEVVVLQSMLDPNFTSSGSHNPKVRVVELHTGINTGGFDDFKTDMWESPPNPMSFSRMGEMFRDNCVEQLKAKDVLSALKAEKFDLGVVEFFDICGLGLLERIGIKRWITMYGSAVAAQHMALIGVPPMPSFVPGMFDLDGDRTFWTRTKAWVSYGFAKYVIFPKFLATPTQAFEPGWDYEAVIANSAFLLENADEFVMYSRPTASNVVSIAGLGMKNTLAKSKSLEGVYQKIFDSAKKGVVYMSFGSVAQSRLMPDYMKKNFLEAFSEFSDVQFIWKYENDEDKVAEGYKNVHTSKWLPQREILLHPRTLAFITHGGMNSITETTWSGVPMVAIPLFGDQPRNSAAIQKKKLGTVLQRSDLKDKKKIAAALREIIEDSGYKRRAQDLAKILRNKPQTPEDKLVKTAEFAASYDIAEHLRIEGSTMCAMAFYNYDVLLVGAALTVVLLYIIVRLIVKVYTVFKQRSVKNKKE